MQYNVPTFRKKSKVDEPCVKSGCYEDSGPKKCWNFRYKVISVPIDKGNATGEYDDFMTGFVTESGDVWGRPVGVTVDKQGALIVTDDGGNCVWRVRYTG